MSGVSFKIENGLVVALLKVLFQRNPVDKSLLGRWSFFLCLVWYTERDRGLILQFCTDMEE